MHIVEIIIHISLFGFVIGSMLSIGLTLTVEEIKSHFKFSRMLVAAIVISFILSPLLAVALSKVFHLDANLSAGLIILSAVAGGPFLSKLGEIGHCDTASTTGLMILLMLISIAFAPLALPHLLPGVSVSAWSIAKPLIFYMLIPLSLGLFIKSRYSGIAGKLQPLFSVISNISMALMMILTLTTHWDQLINEFGTGAYISALIFIVVIFLIAYLLFVNDKNNRLLMGLSAGQRNLGAAVAISAANFSKQPKVLLMILTVALLSLIILFVFAKKGKTTMNKLNKT
jgi:BASS family bile acid:Na+ symporter